MDFGKIAKFTNITNEPFTHAYGQQPFTVEAGQSVIYPFELAQHLAIHLARKILLGQAKVADLVQDKPLWNEEAERQLVGKILSEVTQTPQAAKPSEAELIAQRVNDLNKSELLDTAAQPDQDAKDQMAVEYKDKAEVIAAMQVLGLPVNPRQSKAVLEKQLSDAQRHVAADVPPATAPSLQ